MIGQGTQFMHAILHILCVLCLVMVEVKPVAVYKGCPVNCYCSPEDHVPVTFHWALKAHCYDIFQEMPQLTPNITSLELRTKISINRFAFSSAPSLMGIVIVIDARPITIHKEAFQSLPRLLRLDIKGQIMNLDEFSSLFGRLHKLVYLKLEEMGLPHLPSEMLCELVHIKHLSLTGNNISSLSFDPCVLTNWTRISSLELTNNPLETIRAEHFYYLKDHNVTELYLDECGLTHLQPGLFQHLPRLNVLDISWNHIEFLPPGIFDFLPNLRHLFIYMNPLASFSPAFLAATSLDLLDVSLERYLSLHEDVFANLIRSPVTKMELSLGSVIRISSAAFDPLHSLQTLMVTSLQIEPEALNNMSISLGRLPLQKLKISIAQGQQRALNNRTFGGFFPGNNLNYLDLSENWIDRIGNDTFQYLTKVATLKLSGNILTNERLKDGVFRGLNSLQNLDLSSNKIFYLPDVILREISATLTMLNLNDNNMIYLTLHGLSEFSHLKELHLKGNRIHVISSKNFNGLKNLETLNLQSNSISRLPPEVFWGMPSLKIANLRNINLTRIQGSLFQYSGVVEELYLGDNPNSAESIEYAFRALSVLKFLELNRCGITALHDEMFENKHMLEQLELNRNFIVSWRPKVFSPLPNLTVLSLSSNRIVNVPESAFKYLTSLAYLDLSGNPLACTCNVLWFKHWISTSSVSLLRYTIKESYTCASPEQEGNTALIDFQLTADDCTSHFVLNLVMGLIGGFLLVCTIVSLTHRFRWHIRYYIFLVRSRRRQMYDEVVENETFRYDVYVCYHNTSRHWVINELLPKLEYEAGIKLCLHDRNWLAGPTIMDNIIESIEQSRKTLLLVNNGFAQSVWCREETSLAYHRLIETQRNMLIVVLLEDVQQENMDKLLRSILTKRVYLRYSQSKKKEQRFWKALKAALGKGEDPIAGIDLQTL